MNSGRVRKAFAELREILGDRATTSTVHRMAYSRDWSPRYREMNDLPDIVVIPNDTQEMVRITKVAYRHEVPLIPFAGGTGMGGGAVAWKGGIMVETKGLNRILEIDEHNMTATVQSGITIEVLNRELARHNLWLPHQPESKRACTIGASIGCDNDSTFGIRYGKIRDCLLNAIIVTGRAEAIRVGQRKASFSSTGYKLLDLLVASEGTLGTITETTLRVVPLPEVREVRGYVCRRLNDTARGLERLLGSGLAIESAHANCRNRLHFYTHSYREKYGREPQFPEWADAILFLSFAGDKDIVDFNVERATRIMVDEFDAEPVAEQELVEGGIQSIVWSSSRLNRSGRIVNAKRSSGRRISVSPSGALRRATVAIWRLPTNGIRRFSA
jgi:glycolate oxidase